MIELSRIILRKIKETYSRRRNDYFEELFLPKFKKFFKLNVLTYVEKERWNPVYANMS